MAILSALLDGRQQAQKMTPPVKFEAERVITIDDSGWGFPLLGTLIGLHDSLDNSIHIGEVTVKYYQSPFYERKDYLYEASRCRTFKMSQSTENFP